MSAVLGRAELAAAALLVVALLWVGLAYWASLTRVGDDVDARLDALSATLRPVAEEPAADRYERHEHRDYSGDRGGPPSPRRAYATIYDELCERMGFRP